MKSHEKDAPATNPDFYYGPLNKIRLLTFSFTLSGIVVSVLWVILFVAGLLVDSSYYRAAISYNFAVMNDWIWVIFTFTFSNVILLAFMSGLLGGITSKLLYTKGFRITNEEFTKIPGISIENPFISAFRGMFVFVAILFLQYVSSYNDLGSIGKSAKATEQTAEIKFEKLYSSVSGQIKDTAALNVVRSVFDKQIASTDKENNDSLTLSQIFTLKTRLSALTKKSEKVDSIRYRKQQEIKTKLGALRRSLKIPATADFSGIGLSSFAYFKFAVIVSFLAFIFGYDPSRFTEFLGKIFNKHDENVKDDKTKKIRQAEN